ncbi:hypothetical protein NKH18_48905 [Streptomyces sp. M10(2022)]
MGWALLGLIGAMFIAAVVRGAVRAARVSIRQDLVSLGDMQQLAGALAKMTTTAYAFAAPLLRRGSPGSAGYGGEPEWGRTGSPSGTWAGP